MAGKINSQKRPILCLHMSPFSSKNFEKLLFELGKDRLAVAMDIPGFGESDPTEKEPTIDMLAKLILDSMKKISNQASFDILGDHTGSVIAIHIAAYHEEMVSRLVLNGIPRFEEQERIEKLKNAKYNKPMEDGSHLLKRWKSVKMLSGSEGNNKIVERNFVEALRGGPFAHWGHVAVFSYELLDAIDKIDQPTLIFKPRDGLEGRTDMYSPRIKNVKIKDLPDENYGFLEYKSTEFASEIRHFLDQI